ncbi:MAG: hypothetical protein IJ529_02600 [Alphaproteobacteria bacterium]|nr:hypothetical protein [Alphaproteobacteria bacterium]
MLFLKTKQSDFVGGSPNNAKTAFEQAVFKNGAARRRCARFTRRIFRLRSRPRMLRTSSNFATLMRCSLVGLYVAPVSPFLTKITIKKASALGGSF